MELVPETTYGTTPGAGTIGALTSAYVFTGETLAKQGNVVERLGLRGTRAMSPTTPGPGPIWSAAQSTSNRRRSTSCSGSNTSWACSPRTAATRLAETLPSATLGFARGPKNFRYAGCVIDKATFSGSAGGLLKLVLEIAGQSETLETTSLAAASPPTRLALISSATSRLSINGASREVHSFELVINNVLVKNRFMNSTTVVNLPPGDRLVTLQTTHAWATANTDLYDPPIGGYAGASLAFAAASHSTTFTFGCLQAPAHSPTAAHAPGELPLRQLDRSSNRQHEGNLGRQQLESVSKNWDRHLTPTVTPWIRTAVFGASPIFQRRA